LPPQCSCWTGKNTLRIAQNHLRWSNAALAVI
jgi:hypothetical protein